MMFSFGGGRSLTIKKLEIMDKRVQEVIERCKSEKRAKYEKERDVLLLSLGLYADEKAVREYSPYTYDPDRDKYPYYDKEKGEYYRVTSGPMEISDEDYEELRKHVVVESMLKPEDEVDDYVPGSGVLSGLSVVWLVCCIIAAIVLCIIAFSEYDFIYFAIALGVLLAGLESRSIVKVFIELSRDIRYIRRKMK